MSQQATDWIGSLADQYGHMVLATAWRVLGDADAAQDVFQEVFLKLLDGRYGGKEPANWRGYLKVMAARCAIDHLRRRARQRWRPMETIEQMPAPDGLSPARIADLRQQVSLVREALGRLPEREGAVFSLRYFEDCSYEEIAEALGLNVNRVGVILHRARKRLLEHLKPVLSVCNAKDPTHV